ncbi:MAG TPA: aldehyde dehydrogenase family protein [Acidimicrobiales bacterium]|nr:aldehyde dehydrogenase family protein [Acidimicrobiales bacterium]
MTSLGADATTPVGAPASGRSGLGRRDEVYIGGAFVRSASSDWCPVVNPATEELIGEVPGGSSADVDAAVGAARAAFDDWSSRSVYQRAQAMAGLPELIEPAADELVDLIVAEVGATLAWARDVHVGRLAAGIAGLLGLADQVPGPQQIRQSLVVREPAGVVGSISPWNYPYGFFTKVVPALLAGCTVVAKPSEVAPFSVYRLTELVHQLGLPPGVFNVVMGSGPAAGAPLAAHPGIDVLTFTGSVRTGQEILKSLAPNITRPVLELGGKSAAIVLPGAPFEQAVAGTLWNCYMNNGQVCGAQTRLLVPAERLDEAAEIAAKAASGYVPGPPTAPSSTLGPVVNAKQYERVLGFIRSGITQGATLVCGGPERPDGVERGYFVRPTVFSDVRPDMTIAQHEIFGPVLSVLGYRDEDDAVRIANGTDYGLSGAVWASSDEEAVRVARRLRTGQVQINSGVFNGFAPFGGFRKSGIGREGGIFGFLEYCEVKALQLPAGSPMAIAG